MKFSKKRFLNKDGHHGIAAISYNFSIEDSYLEGEVQISDCAKTVFLDFSSSFVGTDTEVLENGLYKLQTMIEILQEAEEDYVVIVGEYNSRAKDIPGEPKEKIDGHGKDS